MQANLEPGRYVIAVSGGVDSVVLLHLLGQSPKYQLTVAHFDHGIRPDSAADAKFVAHLAKTYGLPFISQRAELGSRASEATARQARYKFLQTARQQSGAQAIITAHHQDDLLETAILNLLRGTGRRGLTALKSTPTLQRPLLHIPKMQITDYATQRSLSWREDSTNHDQRYTRNYIRHRLLARFSPTARQQLLTIIQRLQPLNQQIDDLLQAQVQQMSQDGALNRAQFTAYDHASAKELLASWLRQNQLADYDAKTLERLVLQVKTMAPGKRLDVRRGRQIVVSKTQLALHVPER